MPALRIDASFLNQFRACGDGRRSFHQRFGADYRLDSPAAWRALTDWNASMTAAMTMTALRHVATHTRQADARLVATLGQKVTRAHDWSRSGLALGERVGRMLTARLALVDLPAPKLAFIDELTAELTAVERRCRDDRDFIAASLVWLALEVATRQRTWGPGEGLLYFIGTPREELAEWRNERECVAAAQAVWDVVVLPLISIREEQGW